MEAVFADFTEKFPDVRISGRAIPVESYEEELLKAAQAGTLPTLFESTNAPKAVLDKAADLGHVLQSEQGKECLFLDQYNRYYQDRKQITQATGTSIASGICFLS